MHSNDLNKQRRAVRQAEEAYYKMRKNGRMAKIVDRYRRAYEDEKRKLQNMEYEMKKYAGIRTSITNNFYKQAKMEVPSEEEKRNEHVPEEYIDKAVGDCDGQECKSKRKDMRRLLEI